MKVARGPGPGLTAAAPGVIAVKGPVTFDTAGTLLADGRALFAGVPAATVSLGGISSVDSAGLALLLEWLRLARSEGRSLAFEHIPEKLLAIARLSGVESLLTEGYRSPESGSSSPGL
ncbi:MAG: STAS domain-containing protein [Gammaproteobacteria bacterium]